MQFGMQAYDVVTKVKTTGTGPSISQRVPNDRRFLTRLVSSLFVSCALLVSSVALSLEIKPESEVDGVVRTLSSRPWWARAWDSGLFSIMESFTHGEHERTVEITWGCPRSSDCNAKTSGFPFAPPAVIAGVRWNDNPPFELTQTSMSECTGRTMALPNFSECWFSIFRDGKKRAQSGANLDLESGSVIMLRSHFGDLQFLHSMASTPQERAGETRDKILMWAEFTWRTARGEFQGGTKITETEIPALVTYFKPGETIQTLFTRGNPTHRSKIGSVAFGSLLHTLHDSFTRSHTNRAESDGSSCGEGLPLRPGRVRQFLNYALQKSSKHSVEDKRDAVDLQLQIVSPNMVDIGKYLKEQMDLNISWEAIKPVLNCIYDLEDENAVTGAGNFGL